MITPNRLQSIIENSLNCKVLKRFSQIDDSYIQQVFVIDKPITYIQKEYLLNKLHKDHKGIPVCKYLILSLKEYEQGANNGLQENTH